MMEFELNGFLSYGRGVICLGDILKISSMENSSHK